MAIVSLETEGEKSDGWLEVNRTNVSQYPDHWENQ